MTGDLWILPGGHRAIEVDGSTRDALCVRIIQPNDEWLQKSTIVPRILCEPGQMKYHNALREDRR